MNNYTFDVDSAVSKQNYSHHMNITHEEAPNKKCIQDLFSRHIVITLYYFVIYIFTLIKAELTWQN